MVKNCRGFRILLPRISDRFGIRTLDHEAELYEMKVKFWGVHGSLPRPGPRTLKYGGNTPCLEVASDAALLILDAGTGIRELGADLILRHKDAEGRIAPIRSHIFISHFHWDHIQGLPFFAPAYLAGNELDIYGVGDVESDVNLSVRRQMAEPNFPVTVEDFAATFRFHDLEPGDLVRIEDFEIRVCRLNHPGGCSGYRVSHGDRSIVYATDTENVESVNAALVDLCRDADALIIDSMFDPDQYLGLWDNLSRETWGHSTWEMAAALVEAAGVKQLILFHHGNTDDVVEEIERKARERFPNTIAAYEGLELTF